MLRFMTWLCLKDKTLSGSQMCIVTGPRIDVAIDLIDRMKRLFYDKGLVIFDNEETVIDLNGVKDKFKKKKPDKDIQEIAGGAVSSYEETDVSNL